MRRFAFLSSAAALAAAAFLQDVALAAEGDSVSAELAPLVETLLPFGTLSFPAVQRDTLVQRIDGLFKLESSPVFRASLRGFSELRTFSAGANQLFAAEKAAVPEADLKELTTIDATAFAASGIPSDVLFQDLALVDRSTYVRLWSQSAFSTRRRFYGSVRAITFLAFYSLPESWPVIGYGGPLLHERHL